VSGLKIAQVATSDISIRVLLLDQIKALRGFGHEIVAVCSPGPSVERVRQEGIEVITIPMAREFAPLQDLRSLYALTNCFRKYRFDVVHTHTPKAGLLGPIAAKLAGTSTVVHTIHGLLFHDQMPLVRRAAFWAVEKTTATFADHLLSQSLEDVNVAIRTKLCVAPKIRYLGNGIDIRRFKPSTRSQREATLRGLGFPSRTFVVGTVARLVRGKGLLELFAAAENLTGRYPDLKFVVIGPSETGHTKAIDPAYIQDLQRRGTVVFVDWQEEMERWYEALDVFVLASHREGLPRVCMEAAAMALPIVATDIRGCREVVKNEQTGLLVSLGNAAALANAIEFLYRDRPRARAMGELGRHHIVANFDRELVHTRLGDFYRSLRDSSATTHPLGEGAVTDCGSRNSCT
jgi:glycosyltransferase involved in cell wall biosynthesis